MARSRRIALAYAITFLVLLISAAVLTVRVRGAREKGTAGFNYVEKTAKRQPKVFGLGAGQILMLLPDGTGAKAGLKRADEILSINGVELTDTAGLKRLDDTTKAGDEVVYRIRRDGAVRDVPVRMGSPFTNPFLVAYVLVNLFVALCFIATGLLVFTRKPEDRRVVVFFAMMIAGAMAVIGNASLGADNVAMRGIFVSPATSLVAPIIWILFTISFAPLTLHMSLIFPEDRPILRNHPRVLRLVYGIPVLAALAILVLGTIGVFAASRYIDLGFDVFTAIFGAGGLLLLFPVARAARTAGFKAAMLEHPLQSLLGLFGVLTGTIAIAGALKLKWVVVAIGALMTVLPFLMVFSFPVVACIALYRSYREAGVEQRRQVKWPLWGVLIALAVKIVFSVIVQAISILVLYRGAALGNWISFTYLVQIVPVIGYLLIPMSFAFAILKYRLMNIDVIIKKTVAYAILSGAVIFIYLILVGGLGTLLIKVAGVKNTTTVIAATLVVAAVFVPLRNRLQHLVDRNLFRQKYDYPQALRAISADTVAAVSLSPYLTSVAEKIQQAIQNRAVVIYVRREAGFIATAKVGPSDAVLGSVLSAQTAESVDRPLDPRRRSLPESDTSELRRLGISLLVPVRSHGAVAALIALAPKLSDQEFDLEDIEFVSSAADHLAVGADRIRLQHEEIDFEQARAMQQSLLPAEAPEISGLDVAGFWQPARAVGGDYYDLLKLSETKLAVCIGDVAGKGMPAALLMSGLQAAVRASATEEAPPNDVVERVRRVVVPSLSGRFVTFFYCVIDTQARQIRYCNAGHNQPVIVRADGTTVRLSTSSPVLSRLFRGAALANGEIELQHGDRLVLFTDGVSEARDATDTDFGEQRLEDFVAANRQLGAKELVARISAAVTSFAGGRADDDLTLVAVAVNGPA
jgi:serine phosphatase RsbU (regulator of sigma subunit)